MAKKSREPQRFGNADYAKWFEQIIEFKGREEVAGTWPVHLDADLDVLHAEMWDAWDDYDRLDNELHKTTYPAYDEASTPVLKRLQSFRELLPTLFGGDDAVLGEFGIAREIPRDKEDLFTMASGCIEHWNDLDDAGLPPEYAPVEDMFAEFTVEYDVFQAAYTAYIAKTRDVEEAQNLFLEKREACHDAERLVFHWYKGLHLDGEDQWWTATPWGTVSGGGGAEEPGPEPPENWDDEPTGFTVTKSPLGDSIDINCVIHTEADGINIYHAEGPFGGGAVPVRPNTPEWAGVPMPMQVDVAYNKRHWIWVCAVKDGEEGDFAGPLWVEFSSVEPIEPVPA